MQRQLAAIHQHDARIHALRIRRSLPFFADVMGQPEFVRGDDATIPPLPAPAHADITFTDRYDIDATSGVSTLNVSRV